MIRILIASGIVALLIYLFVEHQADNDPDARHDETVACGEFMDKFEQCRGDPECPKTEADGFRFNYCARVLQ